VLAVTSAHLVAWICFFVGLALLLIGVFIGLATMFPGRFQIAEETARTKIAQVRKRIDDLQDIAVGAAHSDRADEETAGAAVGQGEAAKSALDDVASIIGSLPETLRFPGLLVLVGALLMSVGTVEFGGHSLF
jgi:hypothetical protein